MPLNQNLQTLINNGFLTPEQAEHLPYSAALVLENADACAFILANGFTAEQILRISSAQSHLFRHGTNAREFLQLGLASGSFTTEQVLSLPVGACWLLGNQNARAFIIELRLTTEQILQVNEHSYKALADTHTQVLIREGIFTAEQILGVTCYQTSQTLVDTGIQQLIRGGIFTAEQILGVTLDYTSQVLMNTGIQQLIRDRIFTPEQILGVTDQHPSRALRNTGIQQLIRDGTFTPEQILGVNDLAIMRALQDPDTQARLRDGRLTAAHVLNPVPQAAPIHAAAAAVPHAVPQNINRGQSTHTASVHQSASESARNLYHRYGWLLEEDQLEPLIQRFRGYVNALDPASPIHAAAKRCALRITDTSYTFEDPSSRISTRQLLALITLAIEEDDSNLRHGTFEDGLEQLAQGLYEIQRGYNLSDASIDTGGPDVPICSSGTFNKLLEKMVAIHNDCSIRYITHETAALKLPIVILEEAMRYLDSLAHPETTTGALAFSQLMTKVHEEGVSAIWDHIQEKISERMLDEFGSLYQNNKNNPQFMEFISAGQYTELGDLGYLQKYLVESDGYAKLHNQLRESCAFLPMAKQLSEEKREDNTPSR